MIEDLEDLARRNGFATGAHMRQALAAAHRQRLEDRPGQISVLAYVNHGRWVAACPCCSGGAERVSRTERLFFCHSCGMVATGGKPAVVVFPRSIGAIERALKPRPVEAQNWAPGETVTDLQAENARNGIGG